MFLLYPLFVSICIYRFSVNLPILLTSDTEGYYSYLPALFIQHGFHHIHERNMNSRRNEKGEVVIKYTCGVAFCYLPFFLGSYVYTHINGQISDGFTRPYQIAMVLCGVFWACLGLYFLKKLLLKYFSVIATWATLFCIVFGTNFFEYAAKEVGMSHIYSFALFATTLYYADKYYTHPDKKKAITLAILTGWIFLVRPTNITLLVFIALYKTVTLNDLKERLSFWRKNISHIILAIPFFILVQVPQMLYWKEMTGKWITYSYTGEGFTNWLHPRMAAVLFDTQNGLFLYSPILIFFVWGLFAGRKQARTSFIGTSIVFILITYLFASWWEWWFGAAFGHRCYVEYYTILAFPFAVAMEQLFSLKNRLIQVPLIAILLLFSYYSVRLSFLYDYYMLYWDGPEWRWSWGKFSMLLDKVF